MASSSSVTSNNNNQRHKQQQQQHQQQEPSSSSSRSRQQGRRRQRQKWRRIITRSLGLVLFFAVAIVGYSVSFMKAWKLLQEQSSAVSSSVIALTITMNSTTSSTSTTSKTTTTSTPPLSAATVEHHQQRMPQQRRAPINTTTSTSTPSASTSLQVRPPPRGADWPVFTQNQMRALLDRLPPANLQIGNFTSKDNTCIHGYHPNHGGHMAIVNTDKANNTRNHYRSTVEYIACCGLGHRLTRLTAAIFVARKLQAEFHQFWSCCNGIPVFSQLFGDEPLVFDFDDQQQNTTTTIQQQQPRQPPRPPVHHLQFHNEVPGFFRVPVKRCSAGCSEEKIQSDYWLYKDVLMQRYHLKHIVDEFVQTHFAHRTSIGIHSKLFRSLVVWCTVDYRSTSWLAGCYEENVCLTKFYIPYAWF